MQIPISIINQNQLPADGWTPDTNTWTYVDANNFEVVGVDVTAIFTTGTRLRLKQGGAYKYFVVTASSFSTDTTVTITGGDDYSLANASITDNYYSYEANPQGYPGFFNWDTGAAVTGFAATPTSDVQFSITGTVCTIIFSFQGTSNATTLTWTLPAKSFANSILSHRVKNNGTIQLGRTDTGSATTASVVSAVAGTAFTASGAKDSIGVLVYEIG